MTGAAVTGGSDGRDESDGVGVPAPGADAASSAREIEDDEATSPPPLTPESPGAAPAAGADGVAEAGGAETRPVEISGSQVTGLRATTVTITQSRVESLTGERVDLRQASAGRVEARMVQFAEASAVRVETGRLVAERSRVVGVVADQARFVRSRVGFVVSRQVELGTDSRVLVHLGPLGSKAQPAVSTRTAAAFGAGLGAALVVGRALLGRR